VKATTEELVATAFACREAPVAALAGQAEELSRTCQALAERFRRGGRLLVFGNGGGSSDAQHVAVEFVHPVVVGKRALPALSLVSDAATLMGVASRSGLDEVYAHQVQVLARPEDIALGISVDGRCRNVQAGLLAARRAGLLTLALTGGDGGGLAADHVVVVPTSDALVVKEGHVTAYHLLWELTHVFLEGGEVSPYPMMYGGQAQAQPLLDAAAASARAKVAEVVELRARVGADQGAAVAACAEELAASFAAGGTLLAFGNGGSSTDAQDAVHTFLDPVGAARPLPALGLTNDVAVVTALSNDVSFDVVFARQLRAFGRPGDIALALSTSGGSTNVLAGLREAAQIGMVTVGVAGDGGGAMADVPGLRHLLTVPSASVHRVQEVQTTLYHVLWEMTSALLG
jgi:D-sedoheptulose 7-phosphate isomerase